MATYVTLLKFTEKGEVHFKDSGKRAAAFKTEAKKLGIEVKEQLWCMGVYDGVLVLEAPDDETAAAAMLSLGAHDSVSTQTMRAFTATEMGKILGKIA
jgi:uncharacterized protein with GYD domain